MAKTVKDRYGKPVITMGNIRDPKDAENVLLEGKADFIGIGRGLIADPYWCKKAEAGEEDSIRKCISCNIGCAGHRIGLNRPIKCTVNPDLINEGEYKNSKIDKRLNVAIIGGGTAGMEAACSLAEIGCNTFVFEKKERIGGLAREIAKFPAKNKIEFFPTYLENRAKNLKNLIVFTNTTATIEKLERIKPDLIINATGSLPLLPNIKGLKDLVDKEDSNIYSILGTIKNIDNFQLEGKKVVVIGGGAVGLDVVEFTVDRGAKVSIVEKMGEIGKDLDYITKVDMTGMLKRKNVNSYTETSLIEVKKNSFVVELPNKEIQELEFDYGFVCLGMRSNIGNLEEIKEHFGGNGVEVINIGDSLRARKILEGVAEARNLVDIVRNI